MTVSRPQVGILPERLKEGHAVNLKTKCAPVVKIILLIQVVYRGRSAVRTQWPGYAKYGLLKQIAQLNYLKDADVDTISCKRPSCTYHLYKG